MAVSTTAISSCKRHICVTVCHRSSGAQAAPSRRCFARDDSREPLRLRLSSNLRLGLSQLLGNSDCKCVCESLSGHRAAEWLRGAVRQKSKWKQQQICSTSSRLGLGLRCQLEAC
eukprot:1622344-Rhodomonas_salina.1